jgi:elongation factor G
MSLAVNGEAKHRKQTGGRGQYGHVVLRLIVDCPDTGITIENVLPAGVIPAQYVPAIEAGIHSVVDDGKLAERGYSDARVELIDGSFHTLDSSDASFFAAAVMAMEDALRQLPSKPTGGEGFTGVREPRFPPRANPSASIAIPEPDDD